MPTNPQISHQCQITFEKIVAEEGGEVLGWRKVSTSNSHLGDLARSTEPVILQIFIAPGKIELKDFERKLYVIRRLVEKEVLRFTNQDIRQFYICSLSGRTLVYKGLLSGSQITAFYQDLQDPDFQSPFSLIHQRYSTNTLPTWNLAQPFRFLAHNGEINTLKGNISRMKGREGILKSPLFNADIEKIIPILNEKGSDSAIFDNAFELLVMGGRSLPHAMMMMIPEATARHLRAFPAKGKSSKLLDVGGAYQVRKDGEKHL